MFENLSEKFESAFKTVKGQGKISDVNIAESVKEIRRALLDADVNYATAKDFTNKVREKAMGEEVLNAVSPGQQMVKITNEELTQLMGGEHVELSVEGEPAVILMSGLQGSGKTTFSGKLSQWIKNKKGRKVLLAACDVYRPAAIDQLHVVGEQTGVEVFSNKEVKDPVKIANDAIEYAKKNGHNAVIIDTAGRLAVDEEMMDEIDNIKKAIQPTETLFVVDSMTGQDAVNTAKTFNERIDFDGVILTKLDGDTRGGAALSIKAVVNKPIKFIGTGEKMDALELFHPDRMADRILGMGDVVSLVEKAEEQYDEKQAQKLQKKIAKDKFDFNDFLEQIGQIKKMGNMKDLLGMIPGMGKAVKNADIDDDAFKSIESIIHSMTPEERENPEVINGSRRKRIARGSGTTVEDINKLLKQFKDMRKMMKMMGNKKNMNNMMQQMGGMPGGGMPGMK